MSLYIQNIENCIGCGICSDINNYCPIDAIEFSENGLQLNTNRCTACWGCVDYLTSVCPMDVRINAFEPLSHTEKTIMTTRKKSFNLAGKFQSVSEMEHTTKPLLNQCMTLEDLYLTGCELNKLISQSYGDTQIVKHIDIVPKLSSRFDIVCPGIKTIRYARDDGDYGGGGWSNTRLTGNSFGFPESCNAVSEYINYDINSNKYTLQIELSEDAFDELNDPYCYRVINDGFMVCFENPLRYIIPSNADADTAADMESVISDINKISYSVNYISCDNSMIENDDLLIFCRKIMANNTTSIQGNVISTIHEYGEELYTNLAGQYIVDFAYTDIYNTDDYYKGSGFLIEVSGLNCTNTIGAYINDNYYRNIQISMNVELELLYDVDTISHLYYDILLNISAV